MGQSIKHSGTVLEVTPGEVVVSVEARGACAACTVKSLCGMAESQDKLIQVATPAAAFFLPGERVEVSVEQQLGIKAVLIAYVFPFLLVFTLLLVLLACGVGELASGLASLGLLGFYYLLLLLFRGKIARDIVFDIHKTEPLSHE